MRIWVGIFLFWCSSPLIGLDPDHLYLLLEKEPLTRMTICWLTEEPAETNLEYRKEGSDEWTRKEGKESPLPQRTGYHHRVRLKGLTDGAQYHFRFAPDSREFSFRQPSLKELTFAVGGDVYHGNLERCAATTRRVALASPAFVVLGGDLAYACSRLSWGKEIPARWLTLLKHLKEELVTPQGDLIPVIPVIGNHDVNGRYGSDPRNAPFYYALFGEPIRALDFDKELTLVLLDSGHTHKIKGDQAKWLEKTLKKRRNFTHRFALYHVASMPSYRNPKKKMAPKIRSHWAPLFEEYGVQIAFEHHDHAYKRSLPWKNKKQDPDGVVYMGDGCWGASPRRIPTKRNYLARVEAKQHFLLVDIKPTSRHIRAIASDTGAVFDELIQR